MERIVYAMDMENCENAKKNLEEQWKEGKSLVILRSEDGNARISFKSTCGQYISYFGYKFLPKTEVRYALSYAWGGTSHVEEKNGREFDVGLNTFHCIIQAFTLESVGHIWVDCLCHMGSNLIKEDLIVKCVMEAFYRSPAHVIVPQAFKGQYSPGILDRGWIFQEQVLNPVSLLCDYDDAYIRDILQMKFGVPRGELGLYSEQVDCIYYLTISVCPDNLQPMMDKYQHAIEPALPLMSLERRAGMLTSIFDREYTDPVIYYKLAVLAGTMEFSEESDRVPGSMNSILSRVGSPLVGRRDWSNCRRALSSLLASAIESVVTFKRGRLFSEKGLYSGFRNPFGGGLKEGIWDDNFAKMMERGQSGEEVKLPPFGSATWFEVWHDSEGNLQLRFGNMTLQDGSRTLNETFKNVYKHDELQEIIRYLQEKDYSNTAF